MTIQHTTEMEVRYAAKVLLRDAEGNILFVEGPSGRRNLPGGGVDDGEDVQAALLREVPEEIDIDPDHIEDITEIACIQGTVTPGHGRTELSRWTIATARLHPDADPQPSSEIKQITWMSPLEVVSYTGLMSDLARHAVGSLVIGSHNPSNIPTTVVK